MVKCGSVAVLYFTLQWGAAGAEIKISSTKNADLSKASFFKPEVGLCIADCQNSAFVISAFPVPRVGFDLHGI